MTQDFPLILASQSPRRRQLLQDAGFQFTVVPPDESAEISGSQELGTNLPTPELVMHLARRKAADVAPRIDYGIVLGCDTVAELDGQILGKPTDRSDARRMLEVLRGRVHRVYTGLCLWQRPSDNWRVQSDLTALRMEAISDRELDDYLDSDRWRGKAGAFGYQDGNDWLEILSGSESNVVGLPMELLARMLHEVQ